MNWAAYTGSFLKHLRTQPVDHRIIVQTLCQEKVTYLETTENIERVGCLKCLGEARKRGILPPSGASVLKKTGNPDHPAK